MIHSCTCTLISQGSSCIFSEDNPSLQNLMSTDLIQHYTECDHLYDRSHRDTSAIKGWFLLFCSAEFFDLGRIVLFVWQKVNYATQEKDFDKTNALLLTSYNMITNILTDFGLAIEHNKSEVFYFSRNSQDPNPDLDLRSIRGPLLKPKPILRYLGFYFN